MLRLHENGARKIEIGLSSLLLNPVTWIYRQHFTCTKYIDHQ